MHSIDIEFINFIKEKVIIKFTALTSITFYGLILLSNLGT